MVFLLCHDFLTEDSLPIQVKGPLSWQRVYFRIEMAGKGRSAPRWATLSKSLSQIMSLDFILD